ncbi:MAG: sigma-70 family RNA polymerase sigma factor [Clostridia bacterium]|nr:sigma-70 family RNA polymerase sigma factor [Clostridia bacterium]
MHNYAEMSEEALIEMSQKGDQLALEQLIELYQGLLYFLCDKYYLRDGDREDLLQEAAIGLIEAVRAFKPNSGRKFKNFAILCITRELDSCIKRSNRKKHQILNSAIPIFSFAENDDEKNGSSYNAFLDRTLKDQSPSPEELLVEKEVINELLQTVNSVLSEMEKKVLNLRINGHSYNEITMKLNLQNKSVDNAIQRIRKKMDGRYIRTA